MTKIEITAAMVERAVKAGYRWQGPGGYVVDDAAAHARTLLEAALNPPPEPEITVTREMSRVGAEAYNAYVAAYRPNLLVSDMAFVGGVSAAYRAMRTLEPKPHGSEKVVIGGQTLGGPGDRRIHARSGDDHCYHAHRREMDQKSTVNFDYRTIFSSNGPSRIHNRCGDAVKNTYSHRRAGDPK